jgi:F-type H+-transporting ATPase subunit alpha
MEAFAQFASDLDATTQKMLARGSRLTELLKQAQFSPLPVEEQVVSIFAGTRGYLDTIAVKDVVRFERELLSTVRAKHADILDAIRTDKELKKDTDAKLADAIAQFVKVFS